MTVRGAYLNAGDHVIGRRAHAILGRHVDDDIRTIDRRAITDDSYELMNQARAVLLTGGPAYQRQIYPGIYPIDLDRIRVPVVPFGLGWKDRADASPSSFEFTPESRDFVRRLHADPSRFSSARCGQTVEALAHNGVDNVLMTGCPVWYDEDRLGEEYSFPERIRRIVFTMPARPQGDTLAFVRYLARRYPSADRYLAFQAGIRHPNRRVTARRRVAIAAARAFGFRPVEWTGDADAMMGFLKESDLHVGYRVHAHLYSLSQRVTTVLFAEDSRAVGMTESTGGRAVLASAPTAEKLAALEHVLDTRGEDVARAVDRIRETHPTMLRFLGQL